MIVNSTFDCRGNGLASLAGSPAIVRGDFLCSNNVLTSLDHAPKEVHGDFRCSSNQITSLLGLWEHVMTIDGEFDICENPVDQGGACLLLIPGLTVIRAQGCGDFTRAAEIMNTHLPVPQPADSEARKGRFFLCQQELIDAGPNFGRFADI